MSVRFGSRASKRPSVCFPERDKNHCVTKMKAQNRLPKATSPPVVTMASRCLVKGRYRGSISFVVLHLSGVSIMIPQDLSTTPFAVHSFQYNMISQYSVLDQAQVPYIALSCASSKSDPPPPIPIHTLDPGSSNPSAGSHLRHCLVTNL